MSARFLTNPLSAGGGAPMAVAPVSGKIGFVLSRSNPNRVAGGLLLKTTDGGERFINLPLPSDLVYEGLYARSATNVVIWAETPACLGVGQGCTAEVLQSRDGGRTVSVVLAVKGLIWVASTHYGSSGLWLAATTANCYGTCKPSSALYTSSNGGQTWVTAVSGSAVPVFAAVGTPNGTTGYGLSGQGAVYRTTDGGRTWTLAAHLPVSRPSGLMPAGGQVVFPQPGVIDISTCNTVDAGGGGCPVLVFVSTDGGRSFRDVLNWSGSQTGYLHMVTATTGVAIMTGQTAGNPLPGHPTTNIAVTTGNAFATTTVKTLPLEVAAVAFRSAKDGWAVGSPSACFDSGSTGVCSLALATTADGGATWALVGKPSTPITTIGHPARHVWWGLDAVGNAGVLFMSSNGHTWRSLGKTPGTTFGGCGTLSVSWVSRQVGFLASGTALFETGDGGLRWARMPVPPRNLTGIWFWRPEDGYALAGSCINSSVYATTDGGRHWIRVGSLPSRTITAAFTAPGLGYALQGQKTPQHPKAGVRLMRTSDGGRTWHAMSVAIPTSSSEVVGLPGGVAAILSFRSLIFVQPNGSTKVVTIQGSDMSALILAGMVPVSATPDLEVFLPGVGLFGSPWAQHMVLRGPLG